MPPPTLVAAASARAAALLARSARRLGSSAPPPPSSPLRQRRLSALASSTVYYNGTSTHADVLLQSTALADETRVALRDAVRRFAHAEIAPYAAAVDQSNVFPREQLWTRLGELGVLGVTASPEYGGLGLGYVEHCLIMEELSRASASVALSYGAHSNLCVNQIQRHGSEEQKAAALPRLCSGEWVGALAMSEAGAGSDIVGSMKTTARRDAATGEWVISGTKMWITNGPDADAVVLYARTPETDTERKRNTMTAFLLRTDGLAGYSSAQKLDKLGMRGSNTCELVLDAVRVPESAVLGQPGGGVRVLMSGLDSERLVLSAGPLGIMQACLDVTLPYVAERRQFGRPIGEFQLMQGKTADMYTTLAACRAYTYAVAAAVDAGSADNSGAEGEAARRRLRKDCAGAILYNGERTTQMALQAVQALGGNGYIQEYPTGRLLRDAKLYEIGAGTSEIRRMLIGRELLEEQQQQRREQRREAEEEEVVEGEEEKRSETPA